jgi:hypothetical protein
MKGDWLGAIIIVYPQRTKFTLSNANLMRFIRLINKEGALYHVCVCVCEVLSGCSALGRDHLPHV